MTLDELLLDRPEVAMDGSERPRLGESESPEGGVRSAREALQAHTEPGAPSQTVPPVRTIVLDRAPLPAAPVAEREAVRTAHSSGTSACAWRA